MREAQEQSRQGVRPLAHCHITDWLELWLADRSRPSAGHDHKLPRDVRPYIIPTIGRVRLDT